MSHTLEKRKMKDGRYDIEDYIKIHEDVLNYKHGHKELATNIINAFNLYLYKYVNLLKKGVFNIADHSLRKFVSLYTPYASNNKTFRKINTDSYNHVVTMNLRFQQTVSNLQMTLESYSEEEIMNCLIVALLKMAMQYKDYSKPSFHTYVKNCFHYEALNAIKDLMATPLGVKLTYYDNIANDEKTWEEYSQDTCNNEEEVIMQADCDNKVKNSKYGIPTDANIFDDACLNDNWINGITCEGPFKELIPFERKLIIEHYIKKKTDTEIANDFGLCRATINRKRLIAISKLNAFNQRLNHVK